MKNSVEPSQYQASRLLGEFSPRLAHLQAIAQRVDAIVGVDVRAGEPAAHAHELRDGVAAAWLWWIALELHHLGEAHYGQHTSALGKKGLSRRMRKNARGRERCVHHHNAGLLRGAWLSRSACWNVLYDAIVCAVEAADHTAAPFPSEPGAGFRDGAERFLVGLLAGGVCRW